MNPTNYSELYNYYFNRAIDFSQDAIKTHFIKCKEQGRSYSFLHNPILNKLTDLKSRYKLVNSIKYRPILEVYNNRSDYYEQQFQHNIFNFEMFDLFKDLDENENKYYTYILQLAKVNALSEVYKRYRYNGKIYEFMFIVNDFREFELWEIGSSNKNIEQHPLFNKFLYKFRIFEDSNRYKDFNEYLKEEAELNKATNDSEPPDKNKLIEKKEKESQKNQIEEDTTEKEAKNFNLIEIYEKDFKIMYGDLTEYYIDGKKTSYEDYENVLFENWNKHKSFITFSCSPQEASLLLFKLMEFFSDLTFTNIGKSGLFKNKTENIITSSNYGKRVAPFNPKTGVFDLTLKQKGMLKRVEGVIDLIKSEGFKS